MQLITGQYNQALVFTDNIEEKAAQQILELCNQEFASGSRIRIMPDTHAGMGCTIGTTMTIKDKVVPNMVGVDIGCGMYVSRLGKTKIDFAKLDQVIKTFVPSGFAVRAKPHEYNAGINLDRLRCRKAVNTVRARLSIGTLGGGNHFIEVNVDDEGDLYLVIHSGSRYLGKQIAEHYQERASKEILQQISEAIIKECKAAGREKEIQQRLKAAKAKVNKHLAFLTGDAVEEYLHDMRIAQQYAAYNRKAIAEVITREMGFRVEGSFSTIHNYIDLDEMMLRKGAISAKKGETVIIPINMRDGSIIAVGKGNEDWNNSAPHGAGRLMSRTHARKSLSLEAFKKSMTGIYTTTVSKDTLDEAPAAYKPMEEIIANMAPAVDILKIIKPLYNFKAAGD
ncbi:MAG: RtcB family protein [Negativicutes bacterium]|nr:RtcB family protein [Negativicutes bacterium]